MRPRCLWCGKECAQEVRSVWRDFTDPERALAAELSEAYNRRVAEIDRMYRHDEIEESARGRLTKLAQSERDRTFRKAFGAELRHGRVEVRTPTGKYGVDGDGLFHSQRCAYFFGIAAAKAGYRRKG